MDTAIFQTGYTNSNMIVVGATDNRDAMAANTYDPITQVYWGSNWGLTNVDLFAPGVNIWSCIPGSQYQYGSGTSAACPHVAGACALLWSVDPTATAQEIKQAILAGAQPVPALSGLCVTGGRLNVLNAIRRLDPAFNVSLPATASFSGPVGGSFGAGHRHLRHQQSSHQHHLVDRQQDGSMARSVFDQCHAGTRAIYERRGGLEHQRQHSAIWHPHRHDYLLQPDQQRNQIQVGPTVGLRWSGAPSSGGGI